MRIGLACLCPKWKFRHNSLNRLWAKNPQVMMKQPVIATAIANGIANGGAVENIYNHNGPCNDLNPDTDGCPISIF